jgi:hypothetical protein
MISFGHPLGRFLLQSVTADTAGKAHKVKTKKKKRSPRQSFLWLGFPEFKKLKYILYWLCLGLVRGRVYTTPASLSEPYVTAIPIPSIPNAKNPGTILSTVAPHDAINVKFATDVVAVLTWSAIGPIRLTPIRIATNPPINLFIILN